MKCFCRKVLILILVFNFFWVKSQVFEKYMVKQGLSINEVLNISQDSDGFVYLGTSNGLNVFNGTGFKQYNSTTYPGFSNDIICIQPIKKNVILIASELNGLYVLNKETDKIIPLRLRTEVGELTPAITTVHLDPRGMIWIGTRNKGVLFFDSGKICKQYPDTSVFLNKFSEFKNIAVSSICSSKKNVWIGTYKNGLYSIELQDMENPNVFRPELKLSSNNIWDVKVFNDTLFVGTETGLDIIDLQTGRNKMMLQEVGGKKYFSNLIRAIVRDRFGNIWAGSQENGLYKLTFKNGKVTVTHFQSDPYDISSLNTNKILSLYAGKFDNIWIGTWNGGLNKYSLKAQVIKNVRNKDKANILSENMVKCLAPKDDSTYWVGTYGSGICEFCVKKNYFTEKIYIKNNNSVSSLFSDRTRGLLLAGTWGSGLSVFKLPYLKKVFDKYVDDNRLKNDRVYSIVKDKNGVYWLGTITYGLFSLDIKNKEQPLKYFKLFDAITKSNIENAEIRQIISDYEPNTLLVLKHDFGLFKAKTDNKGNVLEMTDFLKGLDVKGVLNFNRFRCFYVDKNKNVYIGTDNGVLIKDYKTGQLSAVLAGQNFTVQDITEDADGNFWFGLYSGGLIKYYPEEDDYKLFLPSTIVTKIYKNEKIHSFYVTSHSGIYVFNPDELKDDPHYPQIYLDNLTVNFTKVHPGDTVNKKQVLARHINYVDTLILAYWQNTFSIDINTVSFTSPSKNSIKYILVGYEPRWHKYSGAYHNISYENLKPGIYTLKVRAANKDNVWNPATKVLTIQIMYPWWRSDIAYFSYFVLFVALLYLLYFMIKRKASSIQRQRIEEMTEQKERDLNEHKFRLFTNISHDIRTPLTLILGPLENILAKEEEGSWMNKQHKIIYRNAVYLLNLVNQILDLRKADHKQLKLNYSNVQVVRLIKELVSQFEGVAQIKKVNIDVISNSEDIVACIDKEQFEKVVMNLISNALNYVSEEGNIQVILREVTNYLIVKVKDDGEGIAAEDIPNLFERFYQSKFSKTGAAGIGLALVKKIVDLHDGTIEVSSEKNKETIFTVKLPLNLSGCKGKADENDLESGELYPMVNEQYQESMVVEKNAKANAGKKSKYSVLVIDDNEDILEYVKENIEDSYTVLLANNGEKGLEKAKAELPSIVICDVMMDGINGIEVCEKLKRDVETSHIPVILLTSRTAEENMIEGFEKGADDYVLKPFSMKLLRSRIKNLIEQRSKLRNKFSTLDLKDLENPKNPDEEFLAKVVEFINDNISDKELGVETIAEHLNMTHDQFYRKIKSITGLSANKFIRKVKLNKAAQYILSKRYSISETLYRVGFSSPSYFTKCFKEEFGHTPKGLLNKYKDKQQKK